MRYLVFFLIIMFGLLLSNYFLKTIREGLEGCLASGDDSRCLEEANGRDNYSIKEIGTERDLISKLLGGLNKAMEDNNKNIKSTNTSITDALKDFANNKKTMNENK